MCALRGRTGLRSASALAHVALVPPGVQAFDPGPVPPGQDLDHGAQQEGPPRQVRCFGEFGLRLWMVLLPQLARADLLRAHQTNLEHFQRPLYRNMQRSYVEFRLLSEQLTIGNPQSAFFTSPWPRLARSSRLTLGSRFLLPLSHRCRSPSAHELGRDRRRR